MTKIFTNLLLVGLFYCAPAMARLSEKVFPVVLKTVVETIDEKDWTVREVSNSQDGYVVMLTTDTTGWVSYNNRRINIVEGKAVLNNVTHQRYSVNELHILTFENVPKYFVISISTP